MPRNGRRNLPPEFHVGVPVVGPEGEVGSISRVVVDPDTSAITDIILRLRNGIEAREVVLPADRVLSSDSRETRVDLTREDARRLPDLEELRLREPEEGWEGLPGYTPDVVYFWAPRSAVEAFVPPSIVPEPNVEGTRNVPEGSMVVSADLDVVCGDEVIGHIDGVVTDAAGDHATHLIVERGLLRRDRHLVPVERVREVTDSRVRLECDARGLAAYPRYRE
ncbi:MAG TPA: hypothetical protein GX715_12340 [Armatimonadetes bacterium]|jgi:sporulation protein YlmC with PRC-barrel domain|nr:hypothetical protein [Armatimonadota bacterium]